MGLDKFSSAEALENSYRELEKEFTKKCQELAKVRNELENQKNINGVDGVEKLEEENISQPVLSEVVAEEAKVEEVPQTPIETPSSPFNLEFRAKVNEFLNNFPQAREYAREISKILLTDRSILNCSNPFKVAYLLAKENSFKPEPIKKEEVKNEEIVSVLPSVSILSGSIVGSAPRRENIRHKSIADAGNEVLKRYF